PVQSASEPPAPISMPTPTRVATPHAPRPTQADIASGIPPTRPDGSSAARPAALPPPLPSPAPPPAAVPPDHPHPPGPGHRHPPAPAFAPDPYATPAGRTPAPDVPLSPTTGPQQPLQQASGPHAVAGASVETPRPLHLGGYDPLQGEAATNRGVVSSRLP